MNASGSGAIDEYDALIVGAGFAGLYMLHSLREKGFSAQVIEAGQDVGGTWYWNRYPGARCDVQSIEYSYSFSAEIESAWRWSERYAAQPEILKYLQFVTDRLDLRRDIVFGVTVRAAHWDAAEGKWQIETSAGRSTTRYLILGSGNLSVPRMPDWPGIETFGGQVLHTAKWPQSVDLNQKRVGVVGTGSSGVQAIPQIAEIAKSLTVFQRTPSFMVPAGNRPLGDQELSDLAPQMSALRAAARQSPFGFFQKVLGSGAAKDADSSERERILEQSWNAGTAGLLLSYGDILFDQQSNDVVAEFARRKITSLIKSPDTARKLSPTDFPIGARRLVSEIGFFDAMNRPNVELVDVREEPVRRVTGHSVVTERSEYPLDVLVLATGFQAITGAATAIHIVGRGGVTLQSEWADGPRSYLGLCVSGFPNLFTITGLGSPGVLSNVVVSIEQHVEWISECLSFLRDRGSVTIEASAAAESSWMRHVNDVAQMTLFPLANSWYHGKTREGAAVFLPYVGGVGAYRQTCNEIVADGYRGFDIGGTRTAAA